MTVPLVLSGVVHICFFLFSVRQLYIYLDVLPRLSMVAAVLGFILFIGFIWVKTELAIFIFFSALPLLSGVRNIGILDSAPLTSLVVSLVYLSWFFKKLFRDKNGLLTSSRFGTALDVLSGLTIFSLLVTLSRYPGDFVLHRLLHINYMLQDDALTGIEACHFLIQGFMWFKIVHAEINFPQAWGKLKRALYIQSFLIILFSLVQLLLSKPAMQFGNFGIFSPFFDVHSYGSYLLVLIFYFLVLALKTNEGRAINGCLALILVGLMVFSGSNGTFVALVISFIAFVFFRKRIAVIIAVIIAFGVILTGINLGYKYLQLDKDSIFNRYKRSTDLTQISKTLAARTVLWHQAASLTVKHPVTGIGIGNFYRRSTEIDPESRIKRLKRKENAHNYFLQVSSELGLVALSILSIIFFYAFRFCLYLIKYDDLHRYPATGLFFGLMAYVLTLFHAHQLLLSIHQVFFWTLMALIVKAYDLHKHPAEHNLLKFINNSKIISLVFLTLLITHAFSLAASRPEELEYEYGFYAYKKVGDEPMRWSKGYSCQQLFARSNLLGLAISVEDDNIGHDGLEITLKLDGALLDTILICKSDTIILYYYVPGIIGKTIKLETSVNQTFNRDIGGIVGKMRRNLGVRMSPVSFLKIIPRDGIGFVEVNRKNYKHELPSLPEKNYHILAAVTKQASLNVSNQLPVGGTIYMKLLHPDIESQAVKVAIVGDSSALSQMIYSDNNWHAIQLNREEIKNSKMLTFIADHLRKPCNPDAINAVSNVHFLLAIPN